MGSLSRESGVFGRVVAGAGTSVPELVREVAAEAEWAWRDYAVAGAIDPDSPDEVKEALSRIGGDRAVDLLTYLAVEDLVFPATPRRDRAHAHQAAERVVRLLGTGLTGTRTSAISRHRHARGTPSPDIPSTESSRGSVMASPWYCCRSARTDHCQGEVLRAANGSGLRRRWAGSLTHNP